MRSLVVTKNLKSLLYSTVLSPSLIDKTPPDLKTCLSSTGSSIGSSSSATFSSSAGLPNCSAFSSTRAKSPSVSLNVTRPSLPLPFLTHLLACICGSIMSGQRRACEIMMPLSTENMSLGSPSMFHERILTGSPSVLVSENLSEHGIL